MRKLYQARLRSALAALLMLGAGSSAMAQSSVTTTPPLSGGNGAGGISFNLTAEQLDLRVDSIYGAFYGTANNTLQLWYNTTAINGAPNISGANGWVLVGSGNLTPLQTGTGAGYTLQKLPFAVDVVIPSGETYGFFINYSNTIYTTYNVANASDYTDGNLTIHTGTNVGYGGNAPTPGNHPRQFNGRVHYTLLPYGTNNIGVAGFTQPAPFCVGSSQNIQVDVMNTGTNQVNNFTVNWEINGVAQTPVNSNTTLDTIGAGTFRTTVSLGSVNFANSSAKTFKVWTSAPNGGSDTVNRNDTITFTLRPSLSGTLTLGGANPDFANFAELQAALTQYGVCGPTTVEIRQGTYAEFLDLNNITGLSSTNTLTLDGGNAANTKMTGTSGSSNAVIGLDGVSYITIRNLTIEPAKQTTDNWGIRLTNASDYITIENNVIRMPIVTTTDIAGIVASGSTTSEATEGNNANHLLVQNNTIIGGEFGIYLEGGGTNAPNEYNRIYANTITDADESAIQYDDQNYFEAVGNTIERCSDGIYTLDGSSNTIMNNYITVSDDGIYLDDINNNPVNYTRTLVANNFIRATGAGSVGIFVDDADSLFIYHNTIVSSDEGMYFNDYGNLHIVNNIIYVTGDEALFFVDATQPTTLDYNSYFRTDAGDLIRQVGVGYADLASWKTAQATNGFDQNSINVEPDFVSFADLHLASNSLTFAGPYLPMVDKDYDGETRCDVSATMGADEVSVTTPNPTANFSLPDSIYENTPVRFINTYKTVFGEAVETKWFVDGMEVSGTKNLDYTFTAAGTYDVRLQVRNCSGMDTIMSTITVVQPSSTPVSDFVASTLVANVVEEIQLIDNSLHGPTDWNWTISPASGVNLTGQGTASPKAVFLSSGLYEVCLTASNALGTGTSKCKTQYILIRDENAMCTNTVSNLSDGRITDDGGPFATYANGSNCSFLIDPCATSVTLKFKQWDINSTADNLTIYDGEDATGTLLGTFNSSTGLPGGVNGLTATSGKMFLVWQTNASGTAEGFSAEWTSVADNSIPNPVADFTISDSIFTGTIGTFTNTSTGVNLNYRWDFAPPFADGGFDGQNSVNNRNRWNTAGNYDVELTAISCRGTSTVTKTVTVIDPISAPVVGFTASSLKAPVLSTITLTDTSLQGPTNWKWVVTPANSVQFTANNSTAKVVSFVPFSPGNYTVKLVAGNAVGQDSVIKTAFINVFDYCTPAVISTSTDIGISRVQLGNIDNSSSIGQSTYTKYFDVVPAEQLNNNGSYELTISRNTTVDPMSRKVWIDWNNDGDFQDSLELVAFESAAQTQSFTTTFTVPDFAFSGITAMRIGTSYSTANNTPCGINPTGEFEDYALAISRDNTAPVITLNGADTIYVEQWYTYTELGATAFDNVDKNITSSIQLTSTVDSSVVGQFTVRYNVSDAEGNAAAEAVRVVIITPDVTAPVITLNGTATVNHRVGTTYVDAGATATDYFNRQLGTVNSTSNVDENVLGTYSVDYDATDLAGNTVSLSRTVNVIDDVAPLISFAADTIRIPVFTAFADPGATVNDNYDQNLVYNVDASGVNTNETGTYFASYSSTDNSNNTGTADLVVIVEDLVAPVLNLIGKDTLTLEVNSTYFEQGAGVSDNYCNGTQVVISGSVDMSVLGEYTVQYDATDCSGNNAATLTRVVRVVDRTAPVLQLVGLPTTTMVRWDTYTDQGYTVTDNYEDAANIQVTTASNLDPNKVGVYSLCYTATDASGNVSAQVCRTITVEENLTGLNEVTATKLMVYPNPSNGKVTLQSETVLSAGTQITVMDALGKVVKVETLRSAQHEIALDLSEQTPGVYLVRVSNGNQLQTIKVNIAR